MINAIVSSPVTDVVLTLLIFFQWFNNRAKEQTVKNNLVSVRRILTRFNGSPEVTGRASDLTDLLDATLATLGSRMPFRHWADETIQSIKMKFKREQDQKLAEVPIDPNTVR